jgi:hypothetical protein
MAFDDMMSELVTLVKADGRQFTNIRASVQPNKIFIDDSKLPIEEGDKFHRILPNGHTEVYLVLDRGFYKGMHGIPDHYQVSVRKETALSKHQTGPTVYNVTGPNARININSVDLSANVVDISAENLFTELRKAIREGVAETSRRAAVLKAVDGLETSKEKPSFGQRYREFIAAAADHMTLLAPFIPALTQLLP